MEFFTCVLVVFGASALANGAEPEVNCSAPRSPEHGQSFLYQDGRVVKYVCEPGYVLRGKELVRCVDGQWEDPLPLCLRIEDEDEVEDDVLYADPLPPVPPSRPLFNWGDNVENEVDDEKNETSEETPMSDEARLHMVLYPRRRARIMTSRFRTSRLRSSSELEEEEKKRSDGKKGTESTTIHLETPPSVLYVRRTVQPGKTDAQEEALKQQYQTASLHMTVDNKDDVDHVEVVTMPRAAVSQDDKGYQSEETLRHMYWLAHHYYPRQSSLVEYRSGNPVVMTLSDSQINWINSLHPELRDQYLKDLYIIRADEASEGARAQAFLRRYEDAYNIYYNSPYYLRRPLSMIVEDPVSNFDYSCHEAHNPFIRAPRLPNMHIARYDRRQNPNHPKNHYLSAVYRCNPGYVMLDARHTELHCSKKHWVGVAPVCVPRG